MFRYALVEHLICNQGVTGSIPVGGTKYINHLADFSTPIFRGGVTHGLQKPDLTWLTETLIPILSLR